MLPDYYQILGVSPNATLAVIKGAYRRMTMRAHPDQGGSHAQMVALNEAFEVLSDPQLRREYDFAVANPEDSAAQSKAAEDSAYAQNQAEHYPREWSAFERWMNDLAADVQSVRYEERGSFGLPDVTGSLSGIGFVAAGALGAPAVAYILSHEPYVPTLISVAIFGAWLGIGAHYLLGMVLRKVVADEQRSANSEKKAICCPRCDQRLRIPVLKDRIEVTCPSCCERFFYPHKKSAACPHCSQQLRVPWGQREITCPCCRSTFVS